MNVFLGIDIAEERRGLDLVALDGYRQVVSRCSRATVTDVTAVIAALRPDVACIDSPALALSGRSRAAERQLRRFSITPYSRPTDPRPDAFYRSSFA